MEEQKDAPKKAIVRSAAYPSLNLEDSLEFAIQVSKNFPAPRQFDREDVLALLDKSSNVHRDIAACVQFGLFEKREGKYSVAPILKEIQNPLSDAERIKTLKKCFAAPKLYRALIDEFDSQPLPALRVQLIRFHAISENAADNAAEIFIESGKYCNAIGDDNVLDFAELNEQAAKEFQDEERKRLHEQGEKDKLKTKGSGVVTLQLPPAPENDTLRFPLPGGRSAFISYPKDLSRRDVDIITKQVEVLLLLVE